MCFSIITQLYTNYNYNTYINTIIFKGFWDSYRSLYFTNEHIATHTLKPLMLFF